MRRYLSTVTLRITFGALVMALLIAGGFGGHALMERPSLASSTEQATEISPTVQGTDSETRGAGGHNEVRVINKDDYRLRVDGRIQLNHIDGPNAAPYNSAFAYSSCTGCQTFAVALQINLISSSATNVSPKNYGVALNYKCTDCHTEADALQYNISVSDPNRVARDERDLIKQMSQQLRELRSEHDLSVSDVQSRINDVINQFKALAASLKTSQQERTDNTTPGASDINS